MEIYQSISSLKPKTDRQEVSLKIQAAVGQTELSAIIGATKPTKITCNELSWSLGGKVLRIWSSSGKWSVMNSLLTIGNVDVKSI